MEFIPGIGQKAGFFRTIVQLLHRGGQFGVRAVCEDRDALASKGVPDEEAEEKHQGEQRDAAHGELRDYGALRTLPGGFRPLLQERALLFGHSAECLAAFEDVGLRGLASLGDAFQVMGETCGTRSQSGNLLDCNGIVKDEAADSGAGCAEGDNVRPSGDELIFILGREVEPGIGFNAVEPLRCALEAIQHLLAVFDPTFRFNQVLGVLINELLAATVNTTEPSAAAKISAIPISKLCSRFSIRNGVRYRRSTPFIF